MKERDSFEWITVARASVKAELPSTVRAAGCVFTKDEAVRFAQAILSAAYYLDEHRESLLFLLRPAITAG